MKIYKMQNNELHEYKVERVDSAGKGNIYFFNQNEFACSSVLDTYIKDEDLVYSLDKDRAIKIYKEKINGIK